MPGNNVDQNVDQDSNNFDETEPRKIGSRVASIDYDDIQKHFSYEEDEMDKSAVYGPTKWGKISTNCNGNHQSPVNIVLKLSKRLGSPPLLIKGFDTVPSTILMANNGHSALVKLLFKDNSHITISGGPLHGSYVLDNIHWHWGKRDIAGSEHAFDGTRFAAEMHFVSYSSNFCKLSHRRCVHTLH